MNDYERGFLECQARAAEVCRSISNTAWANYKTKRETRGDPHWQGVSNGCDYAESEILSLIPEGAVQREAITGPTNLGQLLRRAIDEGLFDDQRGAAADQGACGRDLHRITGCGLGNNLVQSAPHQNPGEQVREATEGRLFKARESRPGAAVSPDHVDGPDGFSVFCYAAHETAEQLNKLFAAIRSPAAAPSAGETPETDAAARAALEALNGDYAFAFGQMHSFARSLERRLREAEQRAERAEADARELREALEAIAEGCSFPSDSIQKAVRDRARSALAAKEGKDG